LKRLAEGTIEALKLLHMSNTCVKRAAKETDFEARARR
jgi:hypothetical protein